MRVLRMAGEKKPVGLVLGYLGKDCLLVEGGLDGQNALDGRWKSPGRAFQDTHIFFISAYTTPVQLPV
jgi:hypothetical protein